MFLYFFKVSFYFIEIVFFDFKQIFHICFYILYKICVLKINFLFRMHSCHRIMATCAQVIWPGANGNGRNLLIRDAVFGICERLAVAAEPICFDRMEVATAICVCSQIR